jgi:hypothetical protein
MFTQFPNYTYLIKRSNFEKVNIYLILTYFTYMQEKVSHIAVKENIKIKKKCKTRAQNN